MNAGTRSEAPRADALATAAVAALGLHVWIAMIVLPGLFAGALTGKASWAAALPPAALAAGLLRRSEFLLLFAVPAAVMAGAAAAPEVASPTAYDPIRFAVVSAGLVAYLFAASALCAPRRPAPPRSRRELAAGGELPPRWRRRLRVYRGFAAVSLAFPVVFVYAIHFDPQHRAYLREMFPGRVEAFTTALAVLATAAWLGLFVYAFAGALGAHRRGDRDLRAKLAQLRGDATRGHPRAGLYLGIATAVVLALVFTALRAQGGG